MPKNELDTSLIPAHTPNSPPEKGFHMVTCYTIIEAELKKGTRTEAKLIEKCEEIGFNERGIKVALTRGSNSGRFVKYENGSYGL
jgi:DNA-binding transcriptional regulator PaaX